MKPEVFYYLDPHTAFLQRRNLKRQLACKVFWVKPHTTIGVLNAKEHVDSFREIADILQNGNAYLVLFSDGMRVGLLKSDLLCIAIRN